MKEKKKCWRYENEKEEREKGVMNAETKKKGRR